MALLVINVKMSTSQSISQNIRILNIHSFYNKRWLTRDKPRTKYQGFKKWINRPNWLAFKRRIQFIPSKTTPSLRCIENQHQVKTPYFEEKLTICLINSKTSPIVVINRSNENETAGVSQSNPCSYSRTVTQINLRIDKS